MSYHNIRITGIPAPLATDYDRQVNFTDFEVLNPGVPPRGVDLDAEFNAVQQALDETQDRLRLVQRDDGALQNESVGLDQLKTEAKIGVNTPQDWAAFTQYQVNDSVIVNDGAWYIALASHVSSGTFQDDLNAGLWEELINLVPYTTEAKNWADYPVDQLVPEGNGVDEYSSLHHRTYSETAQTASEAARDAAQTARDAAQTAESGAQTAESGAVTAQGLAEDARDAAQTAQTGAETAEEDAQTAKVNTQALLDEFEGKYWGAFASEPATDPNGAAADAGDLYLNTTDGLLYVYTGSAWRDVTENQANAVSVAPAGDIAATDVQAALEELDAEKVPRTALTGSAVLPAGTTAQRDGAPSAGYLRFNADTGLYEGYNGSEWVPVGAGATGSAGDQVFVENDQAVTADYTIPGTKNAMTTGPITINDGVTVTVSDGARWVVI